MVYGVLRLINFAHGDVYMIGAMVAYYAARALLAPGTSSAAAFFALLLLSMVSCGALGFLIERLAYRPLRHAPRLTALITAIGVSLLLENGGQLVFGPDPKFFPQLLETRELSPGSGIVVTNVQILVLSVSITLMVGLQFLVYRTRIGTALRAVSFSAEAASLMGIDVDRVISLTFVLGSMLAGAAGVLVGLSNPKIAPLMGIMPGVSAGVGGHGGTAIDAAIDPAFGASAGDAVVLLLAVGAGALLAAAAGVLVGIPALRLKSDYLAIATLGFGEIIRVVILNLDVVGGARGLGDIPALAGFFWVYLFVIITILTVQRIVRLARGLALLAVREVVLADDVMG